MVLSSNNQSDVIRRLSQYVCIARPQKYQNVAHSAFDLVYKMLLQDPARRITDFDFEGPSFSEEQIKDLI
ncbi:mitogen-activated protein kinase 4a-like [Physcomitrium patens]|uniref:mitogen-activated protein kinase 4a-like n=1 Tax=Physcomitrium patens TaxID=3218 RepID=UPI003CCD1AD8